VSAPELTAPECSGCKWRWDYRGAFACRAPSSIWFYAQHARESKHDCGPTAKYYEPKEATE